MFFLKLVMKKAFILFLTLSIFSCKKGCIEGEQAFQLNETKWDLFFKNNNTFSFYAKSEIYFKENKTIENYRNFDTIYGTWTSTENNLSINFNNGDKYIGSLITSDSISGTLTSAGNNGVWYATKNR